jgi:hypothetical protein
MVCFIGSSRDLAFPNSRYPVNTNIKLRYMCPALITSITLPNIQTYSTVTFNASQGRLYAFLYLRAIFSNHALLPISLPLSTIFQVKIPAAESSSAAANMPRNYQCEMERLFSRESRYTIWRKLWFWLAASQKELGIVYLVPIPNSEPPAFTEERIDDDDLEQLRHCCYVSSRDVAVPNMRQLSPDHKLVCGVLSFLDCNVYLTIFVGSSSCKIDHLEPWVTTNL